MEIINARQSVAPVAQGLRLRSSGIRPESAGGLEAWQKQNGSFGDYPVSPVTSVGEYITKARKRGLIHIDDHGEKHPWSMSQLSAAAEEGKCRFVNATGQPVEVGQHYEEIILPERIGRDEEGSMVI